MKKNLALIFLSLQISALLLIRFALPGGSLLLILSSGSLIVYYLFSGIAGLRQNEISAWGKISRVLIPAFLSYTIPGILFRHMWWPFPAYRILFIIVWPVLALGIITLLILLLKKDFKTLTEELKTELKRKLIIPVLIVLPLAAFTFFTSTENFCRIFKSYTQAEWEQRWK